MLKKNTNLGGDQYGCSSRNILLSKMQNLNSKPAKELSKLTLTANPNKQIFISDIHMGDDRSMDSLHPYGWLQKNITNLTKFLSDSCWPKISAELVILGDLFDQWVIPTDLDPLAGFENIYNNPFNKGIIDNLKGLAERPSSPMYPETMI